MSPALNGSSAIRHFEHSNAIEISDGITFDFYMGLPHMIASSKCWSLNFHKRWGTCVLRKMYQIFICLRARPPLTELSDTNSVTKTKARWNRFRFLWVSVSNRMAKQIDNTSCGPSSQGGQFVVWCPSHAARRLTLPGISHPQTLRGGGQCSLPCGGAWPPSCVPFLAGMVWSMFLSEWRTTHVPSY